MARINLTFLGAVAGAAFFLRLINDGGADAVGLSVVFLLALAAVVIVLFARRASG
jgi:hypothetical protein